jgi:polyhydroxybutyrate depolymerase
MNKTQKIMVAVATISAVSIAGYQMYWAYVSDKYGQHLPTVEIDVNGVKREYNLFVPENPPADQMPLVILLNGGDAQSWRFPQQRMWESLGEEVGLAIVVPIGKRLPPNEGAWQIDTEDESYHDIHYISTIIEDLASKHSLDEARRYAVGYSLGSMFTYELACHMSDSFAAIASHAGTMPVTPKACDPERNVPIMHIHGVLDSVIAYGNTWNWKNWESVGTMQDIPGLVEFWRDRYQCQNESSSEAQDETHFVYHACAQGTRVEHYRLAKGDHGWPETLNGTPTYEVIWLFLNRYTLP